MGLVTRRQDTLDRLFENFAIDPKHPDKTVPKQPDQPAKDAKKAEPAEHKQA